MKKLIAIGTTLAMFASVAPAFASTYNHAYVHNTTSSTAISGENGSFGGNGGNYGSNGGNATNSGVIKTGHSNANAGTLNLVNTNVGSNSGWSTTSNHADVHNNTNATAESGLNGPVAGNGGNYGSNGGSANNSGNITSGNSNANSGTINVVNTNITRSHR